MLPFIMVTTSSILNRRSQAKFFNKIKVFDEMVERKFKLHFMNNHRSEFMNQVIFILLSNIIFASVSYVNPFFESNIFVITSQSLTFWQVIILNLSSNHIRNCAVLITNRFSNLYLYVNQNTNPQTVILTLKALKKGFDLKEYLEEAFGTHILILCAFDFFFITISLYHNMYGFLYETSWISVMYFITTTVPQIIKCVYLVAALEKLADQVVSILSTKCTHLKKE